MLLLFITPTNDNVEVCICEANQLLFLNTNLAVLLCIQKQKTRLLSQHAARMRDSSRGQFFT